MKKVLLFLIVTLSVLVFLIKPIRTKRVLQIIAQKKFESILLNDSIKNQLNGPASLDKGNYVEFKWYKVLEWGDTAAVFIDVYKHPASPSWRDDFFWPRVTMNYQWSYLVSGKLNMLEEIDDLKLYSGSQEIYENIDFLIKPDRLLFFLKEGYFELLDKQDDYAIVAFYQPIGNIYVKTENKTDTINTMSAKVFINEFSEILIIPFNAQMELWGRKAD